MKSSLKILMTYRSSHTSFFQRTLAIVAISLALGLQLSAQYFVEIHSRWNDDLSEWLLYTDEEEEAWLGLRWPLRGDLSEWEYELGEYSATIRLKWRDDPNLWELRTSDELITARTIWSNDFTEWRITNGDQRITLRSRWKNNISEWRVKETKYGRFEMQTEWENDPRDWIIYDDFDPDVSASMKMMVIFLVVFNSSPK